ncbi:MAG: asparagine synthase-related protein [Planctomycetota bacterium]
MNIAAEEDQKIEDPKILNANYLRLSGDITLSIDTAEDLTFKVIEGGVEPVASPIVNADVCEDGPCAIINLADSTIRFYAHPIGKGTFYYCHVGTRVVVSTSIQNVAAICQRTSPNLNTIAEFLVLARNTPCDETATFVKTIQQVPAGSFLICSKSAFTINPFWEPQKHSQIGRLGVSEAADLVRQSLIESISSTGNFRKVACLISGGLDSSVIASMVKNRLDSFGGETVFLTLRNGLDCREERRLQEIFASHHQAKLHVVDGLKPRLQLEPLRALNRRVGSPSGGLFTGIFNDAIQHAKSLGVEAIYGGEGGDEIFATDPSVIADLISRGKFLSAIQATGLAASRNPDHQSLGVFCANGLLPLSFCSKFGQRILKRFSRNYSRCLDLDFLKRFVTNLGKQFDNVADSVAADFSRRRKDGWLFSMYNNYRQLLDVSIYEPKCPFGGESGLPVFNPIADKEVFLSAMSLRLDERSCTTVGFRPKRLLQLAGGPDIPLQVSFQAKIGVANLVSSCTRGMNEELIELMRIGTERLGIQVNRQYLNPDNLPPSNSLCWALVLILVIWFEELEEYVTKSKI